MKTAIIVIISIVVIGLVAYYALFPKNSFITISSKGKGGITFSRTSVKYRPAPDFYPENGFEHLGSYISKLLKYSDEFKLLIISTPEGDKALGLNSKAGIVGVGFTVEWKQDPEEERMIRDYFKRMNIAPHRDYLADNGGIKDSTRVLDYNIQGNEKEITMLVKDVLKKLCDISETEALNIYYEGT
jgi:hypothetical protein